MYFCSPRKLNLKLYLLNIMLISSFLLMGLHGEVKALNIQVEKQVQSLLDQMTPEEKVGELVLITFEGTNIRPDSKIYDLIVNTHIGGVVLSADQNNFKETDTALAAYELINQLQTMAWEKTQGNIIPLDQGSSPVYVPLFIGIEQDGNSAPSDQIINDLTTLPSFLAVGATWNGELSRRTGEAMGQELAALGFNLYLGPSLNVVDTINTESAAYFGTQTFGGDPYWVGEMGKAYIEGLLEGSQGKMAVIAKHFPGLGGADRSPEQEVATVRKSLEQLKQIELAPFVAITTAGEAEKPLVDGLMVSHIRYQGFQGNIRATTRPISFDSAALTQLLALEPFNTWRTNGGLTVSDNLGSQAIRRFFDLSGEAFNPANVARTAFLAGNDLLYLKDFRAAGFPDSYTTIQTTLASFAQKYREDPVFAQRVDESVSRILTTKLRLYGEFSLDAVKADETGMNNLGNNYDTVFSVARDAVTLVSPSKSELDVLLPAGPSTFDYVTIFTDVRNSQQCPNCTPEQLLTVFSLQDSLLSLYGPGGSNQLQQSRVSSYSFAQLLEMLNSRTELPDPLLSENLNRANWVIFNMLDVDPQYPGSLALKRILADRVDLLRDKNVIVFSYDVPIYLDATEISKLTAYYALYSKAPAFVDVAARVLMQEIKAQGALPVSVSSVGYDLIKATSPDPNQVIAINLVFPQIDLDQTPTASPEQTLAAPMFSLGEIIDIETSVIYDHNGNPVPDGTVVRFTISDTDENLIVSQLDANTSSGIARISYRIERGGTLEIQAASEPAATSGVLRLNVESGIAELIMPTPTPQPTPTPTEIPTPSPTATQIVQEEPDINADAFPKLADWFLSLLVIMVGAGIAYLIGFYWWGSLRWGLRSSVCAAIGGFLAYTLLNLGFPSLKAWVVEAGTWFVLQMAMIGVLFGWIAALIWWMRDESHQLPDSFGK